MPEAMKLAAEIAAKSPTTMRAAKHSMNTTMHMPSRDAYRFGQGITVMLSKTGDAREARLAFTEKRKPVFKELRTRAGKTVSCSQGRLQPS
jgi:1,4-dihydroxy-2-naphthoyl-CoA synthase